jgi:hypothetical protein
MVGLVLGFFRDNHWHAATVLYAVLVGTGLGLIAEIFGWVSDAIRRHGVH